MVKVRLYPALILLLLLSVCTTGFSQKQVLLYHFIDNTATDSIVKELKLATSFPTKSATLMYIQQLNSLFQSHGFLSASVDSLEEKPANTTLITVFLGLQYKWKKLLIQEQDWFLLNQIGYLKNSFNQHPITNKQLVDLKEKVLNFYENNGYPFAKVYFDSVVLDKDAVVAKLMIDKGYLYKMDSIRLLGNAKISSEFIHHYLNMMPLSVYSQQKLMLINKKLAELPFVAPSQPWDITMLGSSFLVNVYLKPKRSNQVDAIVGFLPSNQQNDGKLLFTIDAKMNLQNALGNGETFLLNWQQIQPQSPRLHLEVGRPYIFNSSFGLDGSFDLYKKDSTYLNIKGGLGVQYSISDNQKGKLLLQNFHTSLLNVDTVSLMLTKKLPSIVDENIVNLAFEYSFNNTDYSFNPRKGNQISLALSVGNKHIMKNNIITSLRDTSFNYNRLYDSIQLNTYQAKIQFNMSHYQSIGKLSVVKLNLNAGFMQSPNYFTNELFQLGGYKTLRGFDEESIFASRYSIGTLEYRYLLGNNSFFSAYSDAGIAFNGITNTTHSYIGGGIGLAFETKQGIFNIGIAEGKRNDLPLNLVQSKIHLGFVSFF